MSSPVVVTAVFVPLPGKFDELHAALAGVIPAVHAEEGCELYAIHRSLDGRIVMLEKWSTRELLETHLTGAAVAELTAAVGDLLAAPVEVTILDPLGAGTQEQGLL